MPEKTHYSLPICSEHYFIIIMVTIVQVLWLTAAQALWWYKSWITLVKSYLTLPFFLRYLFFAVCLWRAWRVVASFPCRTSVSRSSLLCVESVRVCIDLCCTFKISHFVTQDLNTSCHELWNWSSKVGLLTKCMYI